MLGIILIAIGIVAFAYQGITYKIREKVVEFGPVEVTTEKTKPELMEEHRYLRVTHRDSVLTLVHWLATFGVDTSWDIRTMRALRSRR